MWVRVWFRNKDKHTKDLHGIIDSGATYTTLPVSLGEFLELDLGPRKSIKTLATDVYIKPAKVTMCIGIHPDNQYHEYVDIEVMVAESDNCPISIIGQIPFFEDYRLIFEKRNSVAYIEPY